MISVYNTLGRTRAPFLPLVEGRVGMYVCGPTVQSPPHIGHGRSAVAFDVVRRFLLWAGFEVRFVQNFTDVDDKIIKRAAELGVNTETVVADVTRRFVDSYRRLGVLDPDVAPAATEHIPEMITLIGQLVEKGLAYPSGGDVYYRVRGFDDYGRLSGRRVDELVTGARVEPGVDKDDPLDFALWKAAKPGEPRWPSPWGEGRPGWHIECSAMAAKYLAQPFDIHAGGADLIFPHHENEIAQSEGVDGTRFARYWLHNGMVNLGGEKLSKSTGHIIDLAEAIDRYGGTTLRMLFLRASYRSPIEYSEGAVRDARSGLDRLRALLLREPPSEPDLEVMDRFRAAMEDDFNTPEALSVVFSTVREANTRLDRGQDAGELIGAVAEICKVLGLDLGWEGLDDIAEELNILAERYSVGGGTAERMVSGLVDARQLARRDRDWGRADTLRDDLAALGILIEDSARGSRWYRK